MQCVLEMGIYYFSKNKFHLNSLLGILISRRQEDLFVCWILLFGVSLTQMKGKRLVTIRTVISLQAHPRFHSENCVLALSCLSEAPFLLVFSSALLRAVQMMEHEPVNDDHQYRIDLMV